MRAEVPPYDLPADQELLGKIHDIHARRCTPCHTPQEVTRADWIDLRARTRACFSRRSRDCRGRRCAKPPYADAGDEDYQTLRQLVEDAVQKAWAAPRRDLRGAISGSP